ncbi:peptidoglycanpeptidase [Haloferula helveola]|uniref:Peptidoglycanpeptidase n=1 Tax=Haloferula helveola TaxID=490095 RepID=A0ABM7RPQ0_9BACT|nr:peptidoglycanpeptidase [Haloferula helveola]
MIRFSPSFICLLAFAFGPVVAEAGSIRKPAAEKRYNFRDGDIVLQGNAGPQSDAVRAATGSPYTHCGVVFQHEGKWMVMEAVQPVRTTPLEQFIDRSLAGTFRAYRLRETVGADAVAKARAWATKQAGKNYDVRFQWNDTELYCSEFVWKLYEQAGVELCPKRAFRTYNLDDPAVKQIIEQRYGGRANLPLDEPAVAPGDIATSKLLIEAPRIETKKMR